MRGTTKTTAAENGGPKVDARSERWREHRKKVRREIVDAAFRSIDRLGPEVSVREIAAEAGTAKPKIYRHFADKDDLFEAVGARLRDDLWAAIFASIDVATNSLRDVVRRSVEEYVTLVDEHPNVLRFFIQGRARAQSESRVRALNEGRTITLAMAEMFSNELQDLDLNRGAMELAAFAAFGTATSATDWWLGPELDSPRRMPRDTFVDYLTTIMISVVSGTAQNLGIEMDPDQPIRAVAAKEQPA
ncbi:TetR/AcrR family transcriptional regulator [Mycobacterium sp. UM_Kg1]|uniref:TetR/AcrR family transcriptional regulator n=1 Tax=Mycobacterium sp. UM_Kg1 TaxID=1545691 RepID=UPI00061AE806|nr:TetR/AcrR family transcriptional regulator [Mycobacterium sp. UM_Kg1]